MVINFLGDSISEGYYATTFDNIYVQVVKRALGAEVNNYSISGTRIAKQYTATIIKAVDYYFDSRVELMDENADVVVVFGGTNDFGSGDAAFGNGEDKTADTFCGGCYQLFSHLKTKFADKPIIVILPLHRQWEDAVEYHREKVYGERKPLTAYREELRRQAQNFGFHVLDLWNVDELNPNSEEGKASFIDGLHPTDKGHHILGEKVAEFLLSAIRRKP